jgi:hypothetical protein
LGFNWDVNSVGAADEQVGIDAWTDDAEVEGGGVWRNVRTVPNNGSSSVTYPTDFSGPVKLRVRGTTGTVEGETTVV